MHHDHDFSIGPEKSVGVCARILGLASVAALILLSSGTLIAATPVDFESHQLNVFPDGTSVTATIGDADNDGRNELVVVAANLGLARIVKVNSLGGFVIVKDIVLPTDGRPIPPNGYVDPKVVDIDGDGDLDILGWLRGNNTKGLLIVAEFVNGSHVISTYPTPEVDAGYNFSVADVNGDGLPDIITTNLGFSSPGRVFVMLNAADSSRFTTSITLDAAGYAYRAFSADLNGDGRADLLSTTHAFGAAGARLYLNNGGGSFTTQDLVTGDGTRTGDATFGDVNSDGEIDIVITTTVPHNVTQTLKLYLQRGGTYSSPQTIVTGFGPLTPRFADFNRDGLADLVVDDASERTVSIFYGDANLGGLGPRTIISTPELSTTDHGGSGAPLPLTVGDIDNDGRIDILFAVSRTVFLRNASIEPPGPLPSPVTGLVGIIGDRELYLRWDPPDEDVDQFLVRVERFDDSTFALVGEFSVDETPPFPGFPGNTPADSWKAHRNFPSTSEFSAERVENNVSYRATVFSVRDGLRSLPSRQVLLTPGAFVRGTSVPLDPKPDGPILLLHGFFGSASSFKDTTEFMRNSLRWLGASTTVGSDGWVSTLPLEVTLPPDFTFPDPVIGLDRRADFYTVEFSNNVGSLRSQALELEKVVRAVRGYGVSEPLNLAAHSNGGLAAREYLAAINSTGAGIKRLVTYGTPHRGADVEYYCGLSLNLLLPRSLQPLRRLFTPALCSSLEGGAKDARFTCDGDRIVSSNFLASLNSTQLPRNILNTSIVSHYWFPRPATAGSCHSHNWDLLVPVSSQDLLLTGAVARRKRLDASQKHIGQGNDFPMILCGISSTCLRWRVRSPVDLEITAPDGRVLQPDRNEVPSAAYYEIDDGEPLPGSSIVVPYPLPGTYSVRVLPKLGASPNEIFTIEAAIGDLDPFVFAAGRVGDISPIPLTIEAPAAVSIDVMPGDGEVPGVNVGRRGTIPVAVLSSTVLPAASIAPESARFGKTGTEAIPERFMFEDVNGDGLMDLLLHFRVSDSNLACGDNLAFVQARTLEGLLVQGSDIIKTVPCE